MSAQSMWKKNTGAAALQESSLGMCAGIWRGKASAPFTYSQAIPHFMNVTDGNSCAWPKGMARNRCPGFMSTGWGNGQQEVYIGFLMDRVLREAFAGFLMGRAAAGCLQDFPRAGRAAGQYASNSLDRKLRLILRNLLRIVPLGQFIFRRRILISFYFQNVS